MKKMLQSAALVIMTLGAVNAQKVTVWFDTGLKAQVGASGIYNKSLAESNDYNYTVSLSSGYAVGGKIGINKNYNGLSLEGMYAHGSQKFDPSTGSPSLSYDWNSLDVYALFRNSKNLGYFEIGPKAQFLSKMNKVVDGSTQDITSDFNKMNFAGVLGFGANILGNDRAFSGILGLRFEYGFTDIVSTDGKANYPVGITNDPTNPLFAGLVFELNWGIGYFGKAQCGARSKFIRF